MNGNTAVLSALFAELDTLGVKEFCVCAGARNAPIIDALVRRGAFIRNFFDERSAAFFALGRVMQTRRPVAVLTTSGTAVTELFPAIIEAHYQNLPLVAITADRPSRYAGSGAPQAIEQSGIFGDYVSRTCEIEQDAVGGFQLSDGVRLSDGPVHFNVRLEEGMDTGVEASLAPQSMWAGGSQHISAYDQQCWHEFWDAEGALVVLAAGLHPADVPVARDFLLRLNAPVVAEATANLCTDDSLKNLLLRGGEKQLQASGFKRVLRLGAVPSGRWWRDLEASEDVSVLSVSHAPFFGLARSLKVGVVPWKMLEASEARKQKSDHAGSADIAKMLDAVLAVNPNSEPAWMRHLSRNIGSDATVFLGNSLPIREWNLAADTPKRGTEFFANRGANGIDGLVSTWLGVSADASEAWLVVGDLSAMYDMNAPWILSQLPVAKRRIVVINNGGGEIFSRVPWLEPMSPDAKRIMKNPHTFSFEHWARMWGMDHRLFTDSGELRDDDAACCVWEVRPDAEQTAAFWKSWQG